MKSLFVILNESVSLRFIVLFLVVFVLPLIINFLRRFYELKKQKAKIEKVEKVFKEESEKEEKIVRYIELTLSLAGEREKITMIRAQGRASRLFIIGTILMVLSVFAPLVSIAIYLNNNPISPDTINLLISLKDQLGVTPAVNDIIRQRDWRILFSGISFGFLFLAAARGILRQEGEQMKMFLSLGQRVSNYENMISALKIVEKNDKDRAKNLPPEERIVELNTDNVIKRIISILLETKDELILESESSDKVPTVDGLPIKEQLETIIKSLK